jgi:adenosine deaminase
MRASNLRHEFEVAAPQAGLSRAQIRQAQPNALETAFLSGEEKEELRAQKRASDW